MNERIQKLYDLYVQKGLIGTTDINTFSNASEEQQRKLYDLGVQNGLIGTTDFDTFSSAFALKKKDVAVPVAQQMQPSQEPQEGMASPSGATSSVSPSAKKPIEEFNGFTPEQLKGLQASATEQPDAVRIKAGIAKKQKESQQKEKERAEFTAASMSEDDFSGSLQQVNTELIDYNEEYIVPKLEYMFGNYGFEFSEAGAGRDAIEVVAPNGSRKTISVDNWTDKGDMESSKELRDFINANKPKIVSLATEYNDYSKKIKTDREIGESINRLNDEADSLFEEQKKVAVEFANLQKQGEYLLTDDAKASPEYQKMIDDYNKSIELINTKVADISKKEAGIKSKSKKLNTAIGQYTEMKSEQGTLGGAAWNSLLNSIGGIEAAFVGMSIDLAGSIIPIEYQMSDDDYRKSFAEKAAARGINIPKNVSKESFDIWLSKLDEDLRNEIDDKIVDENKKGIKEFFLPTIREKYTDILGDVATTKEFIAKKQEETVAGGIIGLAGSVPGIAASVAAAPVGVAAFFLMGMDAAMQEMSGEEFKDIPESEKYLVSVPIGIVNAVLEKFGLKNVIGKSGIVNNIIAKVLTKTTAKTTAKTFKELVENEVQSRVTRGLLTVGAAGLAEAETGGAQAAAEVGIKELYNLAKEKNLFKTPNSMGEFVQDVVKSAAQEAVGGVVMGTVPAISTAYNDNNYNGLTDAQLDIFQSFANDANFRTAIVTDLKYQINSGKINAAQAKETLDNYTYAAGILNSLPEGLSNAQKRKAMGLLQERKTIENQIQGKDEALVKKQKGRIAEINKELEVISEGLPEIEAAPAAAPAVSVTITYDQLSDEAKGLVDDEVKLHQSKIDQAIANNNQPDPADVKRLDELKSNPIQYLQDIASTSINQARIDKVNQALTKIKEEQDAIQKQAAGQVPVQQAPTAGEAVAQGVPAAGPEVTPTAGVQAEEVAAPTMTLEEQVAALESMLTDDESAQFMLGGKRLPSNVTISDAIDEEGEIDYNAEEEVKRIAKDRGIGITRDREISFVARDENNNIIGGAFTSYDGDKYTFDIVIDKEYDGKGVGSELLNRVVNIPYDLLEQNPDAKVEVDVVSPVMQEMLKKRGFEVTRQISEGRVIMEPKDKAQFMLESQQSQARQEMIDEATRLMEQEEDKGFSEKVFDATAPEPTVKPITIEIKENTRLAEKVKRMGLKELIGKKINLVMADQLKVGDVSIGKKILKRMGGPFFPLIDELFGKVAWASMNMSAASSIVNGAIKSDYTVVYNMNPSAIDSNSAVRDTFIAMVGKMPKAERDAIVSQIVNQIKGKKFGKKTEKVQQDISKVKTISDFEKMMSDLDVDTKAAIINMILPSRNVKAETQIGATLQGKGITIESIREMNIEQFVADLPAGALTMVIEVQDKNGNKVTKSTKSEAIITPEQQKQEGLPSHDNYPIYIRGKAVAILSETVPFWNILKDSLNTINVKVAKIIKEKSGRAFTAKEARSAEMRSASMSASAARKVSDIAATEYEKFVSLLSRAFPTVEIVATQKEFDNLISELGAKKLLTKNQNIYGAVYDGKVYLNPSLENYNTPIHEFGHIWLNVAKNVNPELYKKGLSLVSGSPYVQQIVDNKDYQRVINNMRKQGASESEIDMYVKEEALATAIGDRGESFVIAAQKKNFKEWLNKLYSVVRKLTGISKYTAEQLETITFDEFVRAVAVDLMSGNELFTKLQVKEFSRQLQLSTGKKDAASIVKMGRSSGFSEEAIRVVLDKKGFTQDQIDAALQIEGAAKRVELTEELAPGYDRMMAQVDGIIEKGLERGTDQEEIMNDVIQTIKSSDAYKNATDIQKDQMLRDAEEAFGQKQKAAPRAERGSFIYGLGRLLGFAKKEVKMVTVPEYELLIKGLKDYIKGFAKGEAEGRKAGEAEGRKAGEAKGRREMKSALRQATKDLSDMISQFVGEGKISSKQMNTIMKKFSNVNVFSDISVAKFIDYMSKVLADADYASKLSEANSLRSAIKELSKNKEKNANLRDLATKFADIDPSIVEDIDKYNEMASRIKEAVKGSTIRAGKMTQAQTVSIAEAMEYINDATEKQINVMYQRKLDEVQEMLGVDASDLSYEQLFEMLEQKKPITKYNEGLLRSAINKMFDTYSALVEEMLSTGTDPFTGETVDISKKNKDLVTRFMEMDLNKLTPRQALDAADALANFAQNGSTAKMEAVVSAYNGEVNAAELDKKGFKSIPLKAYWSRGIGRLFGEQLMSLPVLLDRMFKGVGRAAVFERMSRIASLRSNKSAADARSIAIINDFVKAFYKLKANGENFNSEYNLVERGMYAFMTRNVIGTQKQIDEEFNRRRNLIKESIDVLSKGSDTEKKKAEIYKRAYDKIVEGSENINDVASKTDPINIDGVKYWAEQWSNIYDDLADVSLNVYNTVLGKYTNYTPDRFTRLDNAGEAVPLDNDQSMFLGNTNDVYKKKTGVLMESTRPTQLPRFEGKKRAGMYIDLSFDRNNANSMYDALIDINTAADIRHVEAFMNSESFDEIVPEAKDANLLRKRIQLFVRNMRDKNIIESDELSAAARSLNTIASIGVGQALGSLFQPIKQMVPVIANTVANAGTIKMSAITDPTINNFINNSGYAIASRGLASSAEISSIERLVDIAARSTGAKAMKAIEEANKKWLEIFLVKPDVYVARASWMAYYEKSLKSQGVDTKGIDYSTHELNKEAADYAQKMVDRQQNISDHDLAGKIFTSKQPITNMFVKMVMPFASFRINQFMRMTTDLGIFLSRTSSEEDKKNAIRSLRGFAVEQLTFKLISGMLIFSMGTLTKAIMGKDEDDEEKEKRINSVIKGQVTSTVTDVLSPLPMTDVPVKWAASNLLSMTQDAMDIAEEDKLSIYGDTKETAGSSLGTLGITVDRAAQIAELLELSTSGEFQDNYGKTKSISDDDIRVLKAMTGVAVLSSIGLLPTEANTVVRNSIKYAKQDAGKSREQIRKENMKKYMPKLYKAMYGKDSMEKDIEEIKKDIEKATD